MTDDLIAWLRVQLDADERLARLFEDEPIARGETELEVEYLDRFGPARMLALVESKRRVVEWCVAAIDRMPAPAPVVGMNVLADLALPYADRLGWREEWRPTGG